MPILTSMAFRHGEGERRERSGCRILECATVHTAACMPDGSVSNLGALDAFYVLGGQLSGLLVEYAKVPYVLSSLVPEASNN